MFVKQHHYLSHAHPMYLPNIDIYNMSLPFLFQPRAEDTSIYAIFLLLPLLGGGLAFISSDCTQHSHVWRRSLIKSRFSPPSFITAFVWVSLYLCMGQASYLAYIRDDPRRVLSASLVAYLTQCLLNHFFIIVLFGLQRVDLALLMIIPLWFATGITVLLFYDICANASMLMMPVFGWVSFNVYLSLVLFLNNPVYTEIDLQHGYRPASMRYDKGDKQKSL